MGKRILIVDDEPDNIHILRIFLASLQYEIFVAESGTEALAAVKVITPDLILLDVMMPDMSGFDICKQLISMADFDIPIIFLSANVQKKDIMKGLQLGAFDYLTKPYDLDLLEMKVSIALNQQKKLANLQQDNKLLAELAYVDALTGLYNRTYLDVMIQKINEGDKTFKSAMMIDMDHFKAINDTFGHIIGDQVLKDIANIIFSQISVNQDMAFRYGGDEFLVLLHDEQTSVEVAHSIIKAVDEIKVGSEPGKQLHVSVSIGVTHNVNRQTLLQMISQADCALLGAKNNGRNRVTVY
ncbi:diguanylate cyclase [Paenibacillus beijingensis]|uniref:Diguanylate cyclase n=1 Tax=Paenibacillus beijingensis TaxID=1126833 RepID=A0A0D5NNB2_9BACL|nr:diguanylate cyclase [Paenibacillus beijingensis]AJY76756.1 hypothetical protein VN24_22035 [Paenibacillus beijingensis]